MTIISRTLNIYIYIYIYVYVCVCVCVNTSNTYNNMIKVYDGSIANSLKSTKKRIDLIRRLLGKITTRKTQV